MRERAFTLIELLIVMLIIAILAGMVVIGLRGIRERGRDTRVINAMSQIRTVMELWSTYLGGRYPDSTAVSQACNCTATSASYQNDLCLLCTEIRNFSRNGAITINSSANEYCAFTQLSNNNWICIEEVGQLRESSTQPTTCTGTTFNCP